MDRLPTIFISHGSPMLALQPSPAQRFLAGLGRAMPRPKAVLVVSAHWETPGGPAVSLAPQPETIHDFGGFPPALFALRYGAPGAPQVAERTAALLEHAGYAVWRSPDRGLDHGAWVPLQLMFPDADIPVTQLSILRGEGPLAHARLGAALAPLRDEGVLVIGSGSVTHNLSEFRGRDMDAPAPSWVCEFSAWMHAQLDTGRRHALLDYRRLAPHAERNHPTEEHLMPLFVAMGAAGESGRAQLLHSSIEYGVLAMDAYTFS